MPRGPKRNRSYEPPFSGARTQEQSEFDRIHPRWARWLREHPPEGVPGEPPVERCGVCHAAVSAHSRVARRGHPRAFDVYLSTDEGPQTFGDIDPETGRATRHGYPGSPGYCLQCGGCQYYIPLEGDLGSDWGACSNARSEYDGRVVFEHHTCKEFRQ